LTTTRTASLRLTFFITSLLLAFTLGGAAQDAASQSVSSQSVSSQIKSETERLQQSLKEKPIANRDLPNIGKMVDGSLKASREALSAGQIYVSLESLGRATDLFHGARAMDEKAEAVKSGLPAFEAEWGKASRELAALDEKARKRDWSRSRAAVRALAEAAQAKTIPLMEGSRGFATATAPKDGLLYMGQAQGEAAFSSFLFSLQLPRAGSSIPLRSYLPELQRLQEKTNAAFQPPKSIELHDRFIALNSTLKLAGELDASKSYAGALYEYLEASRHYGMLEAVAPDAAKLTQLKAMIAEQQKKLAASKRDDSIAQIFVERAQSWLAHADGSASSADELRSAQVIVEQVLPAYYAALKPAAPVQRASSKTVDITLVRWPYT
jgi:murein L,D-transpeptidase YcbB/YkuD